MSSRRALITGISGQDGSYLTELLLAKGYEVYGTLRRHSMPETQDMRISHLVDKVNTEYCDITDANAVSRFIKEVKPDEIYNLAAQSHVQISFQIPEFTVQTNTVGLLHVLEAVRQYVPTSKVYQASSSEVFGGSCDVDGYQREDTHKTPVSPYGCSKLMSYHLVRNYRRAYGLFACNGILFNHSSPRRGSSFVEQKIVYGAVRIKLGLQEKLELGNLESKRDIGHSKDYCAGIHQILQYEKPDDFVLSTGETWSIREICNFVFGECGLDYRDYVTQNPKYMRPQELPYLRGDSAKARKILAWKPKYSTEDLFREMISHAIMNVEAEEAAKKYSITITEEL